jgi:molybdate transport system regulatory protein
MASRVSKRKAHAPLLQARVRVRVGNDIAFGPGKADLLSAIAATGSLVAAAKELSMSYMRAWTLLQTMNHCFRSPLVTTTRGGRQGGKAELTKDGLRVLALYRCMESKGLRAMQSDWSQLAKQLR